MYVHIAYVSCRIPLEEHCRREPNLLESLATPPTRHPRASRRCASRPGSHSVASQIIHIYSPYDEVGIASWEVG